MVLKKEMVERGWRNNEKEGGEGKMKVKCILRVV